MKHQTLICSWLVLSLLLLPASPVLASSRAGSLNSSPRACVGPVHTDIEPVEVFNDRSSISFQVRLTQQDVAEVMAAVHNGDVLTNHQSSVQVAYQSYMLDSLSDDSLAVIADFQAEADARGILPHELDERIGEMTTPNDFRWDPYALEAGALFDALPGRAVHTGNRAIFTIGAISILAVVACDFKIQACATDVLDALTDCTKNRLCDEGECADVECCNQKAANDGKNCVITCGLNGPDGDYGNCCE